MAKTKTPSYSSPKGGRRGCLCENGKYSTKCCDGSLQAQGIGMTTGTESVSTTENAGVRTIVRQNG
jgi:hypothetical protein